MIKILLVEDDAMIADRVKHKKISSVVSTKKFHLSSTNDFVSKKIPHKREKS